MGDDIIITHKGNNSPDFLIDLLEVVVDTNLYLPNMFSLVIEDNEDPSSGQLTYTDGDGVFQLGDEVKIELETDEIGSEANAVKATLIVGEITALEPAFSFDGKQILQVRGYDYSHRLNRGKKTRTYGDGNPTGSGTTDQQIVSTIAGETTGLVGNQVDTSGLSGLKYFYVLQYNQTDLEFLWSRAMSVGYQVYVGDDKKLYFVPADAHRGAESVKPATLTWPTSLGSFHPRLIATGQVDKAVVKGWDPAKKQSIQGESNSDTSKTLPKIGLNKKGGSAAKTAFSGETETVLVDRPLVSIDQAKSIAKAHFASRGSEFVQADGVCRQADPRLIAGRLVTIEGVGQRFSGDYYVTEARHVYSRGQYRATFSVTGRAPNTASHLLSQSNGHNPGLIHGVVTAKVTNLEDPEKLGRVRVMFPWLSQYKNADLDSSWARLANPMGGNARGFFFTPEVDDEVLVAFEHGDVNFPYIVGTLWNNTDKPPEGTGEVLASDKKKVDQRIIRSRSGHLIMLGDKEGEEQIFIESKSGHQFILDDKSGKENITILDKTGKNKMVIDSAKNSMTIEVGGDFSVTAKGKIELKATGDLKAEGMNAEITGKTKMDLKGGGADIAMSGPTLKINKGALEVM